MIVQEESFFGFDDLSFMTKGPLCASHRRESQTEYENNCEDFYEITEQFHDKKIASMKVEAINFF